MNDFAGFFNLSQIFALHNQFHVHKLISTSHQYLMPSPTADASKEHLKFDSSVIGDGDNLRLDWLQCNYGLGAYQQFSLVPQSYHLND